MKRGKTLIVKELDLDKFKLRGKAIITGEWIFCNPFSPFGMDVIPETVGRPTGHYDKNRRMIYEGDILQYTDANGFKIQQEVVWDDENARFAHVVDWGCFDRTFSPLEREICAQKEIVGNIHEVEK